MSCLAEKCTIRVSLGFGIGVSFFIQILFVVVSPERGVESQALWGLGRRTPAGVNSEKGVGPQGWSEGRPDQHQSCSVVIEVKIVTSESY